ncbi:MAG: methyltransferase [Deltaproteobacteria bacterium]|jgi:predicted nicotinamide N-methyase|nr:methyltransferase [Deltaproteobacteria bacterium]
MKIGQIPSKRKVFILENTQLTPPHLCPEIQLHLITDSCPLWHATEPDIERLGIGDPYWGFCWAGGQALARYLLDHPEEVAGKRVIDFGAGCGVEAVAAMMSGAAFLLASDIDPLAVEATRLNALVNGVSMETTTRDLVGDPLTGFDVLLAGDMFYDPAFSRSVLSWFAALTARGMKILLGDPSRGNIKDTPVEPLASYQAPSDVDLVGKYLQKTTVYAIAPRISR